MIFEKPSLGAATFAKGDPSSLGDVFSTAFDDAKFQALMLDHTRAVEQAYDDHIGRVRAATGMELENPLRLSPERFPRGRPSFDPWRDFDAQIDALAAQHPDKRDTIKPPRGVLAPVFDEMRRREEAAQSAVERSPYTARPFGLPLNPAALAGGFAGQMTDPAQAFVNLYAGPTAKVAAGAKAVLWNAAKVGAANMAVEGAQQPIIQEWRAKAGLPNGAGMALTSIALSGLFGFGLDAGVRGASRGLGFTRGADLDTAAADAGGVLGAARDGDAEALGTLVKAAGQGDDPAVRGALQTIETERGLTTKVDGVDDGDGLRSLAQALRHATDDSEPPPGHADLTPPARGEPITDLSPAARGQTFIKDGKPVAFRAFDPAKLTVDADTFQFRRQVNRAGTTGRLSGVTNWDPMASGKVVVFERSNGELVIGDGHHRLELAKRLSDQKPELQGYLFREADGWTPAEVRAYAAKKNMIDSPRVDPVDAARVLRERPDLIDGSVPVGDETIRQARALAKLSDDGFGMVVGGVLPANYASLVGDLVPDKSRHASMMAEIAEAAPSNVREARYLVGDLLQLPVREEVQFTLFGAGRVERSILKERSKVLDQALRTLRDDRRVFEMLNREAGRIEEAGNRLAEDANTARATEAEQVSALIEQLALTRGPVSSWLSDAALSVTQGIPSTQAAKAFARRVADALDEGGLKALIAEPPLLRANGFDDPAGPEARLQVEQLEDEFAADIERAMQPQDTYGNAAVNDFAKSVAGLKERLGVKTRPLEVKQPASPLDLGADVSAPTLFALVPSLMEKVQGVRKGSRLAVINSDVEEFAGDVRAIVAAIEAQHAVDLSGLQPADRAVMLQALDEMAQIVEAVLQRGYTLHDEAQSAGEMLSEKMAEMGDAFDDIASRAEDMSDTVSDRFDDIADELAARGRAEDEGDDPVNVKIDEAAALPQHYSDNSLTAMDLVALDLDLLKKALATMEDAAEKWRAFDPAAATDADLVRASQEISDLMDGWGPIRWEAQSLASQAQDVAGRISTAVDTLIDEKLNPELERLEAAQEAVQLRVDDVDNGDVLYALRSSQYAHTLAAAKLMPEIRAELLRTVDMLPPDVRMRVVDRIVLPSGRGESEGLWDGVDRLVYVALSAGDPVRTSRHEVVHALRQSALLSDQEFDTLYGFAEKLGLRQAYGIDKLYAQPYGKAYGHRGDAYVEALLREETIANMFADYSLNGRRFGDVAGGGAVDKIIDLIVRFMERLRNGIEGLGFRDVRDVFQAIESGDVGRRAVFTNAITDAERTGYIKDLAEACKL